MSTAEFSVVDNSTSLTRSKRKLDDYASDSVGGHDDGEIADFNSAKMRRDEPVAADQPSNSVFGGEARSEGQSSAQFTTRPRLQFFVRMLSEGKTVVIQANSEDTVGSIHRRLEHITGIPAFEQGLIYRGKQLQAEQSLAECSIENDAGLQLVGRMRSTGHPLAWQVIDDIVSHVFRLCKGETVLPSAKRIKNLMTQFISMTPKDDNDSAIGHLQIFISCGAPAVLVTLYVSSVQGNKECAESAIRHFLNSCKNSLPKVLHLHCAPIVLEFCRLLRKCTADDILYLACRSTLGALLEASTCLRWQRYAGESKGTIMIQDIFPFVSELASRVSRDLVSSMELVLSVGPLMSDVRDFTAFMLPLRRAIMEQLGISSQIHMPLPETESDHPPCRSEIECLHTIFTDLLIKMDKCLIKVEERLDARARGEGEINYSGWSQYLTILRELYYISKIYQGTEEAFWKVLRSRKSPLCALVLRYANRSDDLRWLLDHKDVTSFEARRHMVMLMFPDVREDYEELHEMLIDRTHLLAESFEYIGRADPEALHGGLFMEFKNEEATGPGVLREWFLLVCQAIFNPYNALFVACPDDRRRFYPNPASKVHPLHLEYFRFAGRVIALALMHKVQVGVVLDRVFFLQLAGKSISLDDIRDADPRLFSSCKQILKMDTDYIDSDVLGLTFVREVEELGSRKAVELCPNGSNKAVNSKNREDYVSLLILHQFVTSISQQVSAFAQGFGDILCNTRLQKFFFQGLELEDLDWMLCGRESAVSVEDWKAHTDYCGYKENDPQMVWFWELVGEMSAEQRKQLLFFWISVKHLPIEGFCGLTSRLSIYKSTEPCDRLPTSHTCFHRLCFPPYPSRAIMQERLRVITQEHVGSSFGTW